MERYTCPQCPKMYTRREHMTRHISVVHRGNPCICPICGLTIGGRRDNLARHMTRHQHPSQVTGEQALHPHPQPQTLHQIESPRTEMEQPPAKKGKYVCPICRQTFDNHDVYTIHVGGHRRLAEGGPSGRSFGGGNHNIPPNEESSSSSSSGASIIGGSSSSTSSDYHVPPTRMRIPDGLAPAGFEEFETGFKSRLKSYRLCEEPSRTTIPEFLTTIFERMVTLLTRILENVQAVKTNLWMECEFSDVHDQTCRRAFKTVNVPVFHSSDLEELCGDLFQKLVDEKESCEMKGSGWTFARILNMEVRVNVYRPLGGNSYVPLPEAIAGRKAVVNVVNDRDHRCFRYAMLSRYAESPHNRHQRLTPNDFTPDVERRANLDFSDLEYPVTIAQIPKFEQKNGISVNVYGLDLVKTTKRRHGSNVKVVEWIVYPLRVANEEELYPDHYDLLYLTDDQTTHYAYIKDFSRLVRSQLTLRQNRISICKRCFSHFDDQLVIRGGLSGAERLAEHRRYCKEHAALRTDISEKTEIKFEKPERTQRVRYTIFADFECALVPIENRDDAAMPPPTVPPPDGDLASTRPGLPHHHHQRRGNDAPESASVRTRKVHKPYAYAYFVHDTLNRTGVNTGGNANNQLWKHTGVDAAAHFMSSLRDTIKNIGDELYAYRRLAPQLTAGEQADFNAATTCHICRRQFAATDIKVRDHDHHAPYRFRGAAHQTCNLRHKDQDMVNVYFHNLSNYDAHFIIRELGVDEGDVRILANTEEKYISFTKRFAYPGAGRHDSIGVRFVDSYRFLSRALANLVEILPVNKLLNTRAFYPDAEQFECARRKGVFPYEYVDSLAVLQEQALPPRTTFYDNLRMADITDEDYQHAQRVWTTFNCQTLEEYSNIYLTSDVLLLADVFESFRDSCMESYELDPAHYITLPSYAWDVMLKMTGITLDTLQDVDQYLFFEKGIRGGLAQCVTRHVVANNRFTRGEEESVNGHDDDDDNHIMYFDANNLYGWAMSQQLPYGDFQWMSAEECAALDITTIADDSEYGYVLEVDLEYPRDRQLHDRHRDLPFCPEVRRAPGDQLSYPREVVRAYNVGRSKKLMATLMNKENYVIHYKMLQLALQNGLRILRTHRVLRFKQSAWLKPYVTLNTQLRRQAKNKFEQELFKLMVNAVYGMSLQNVRKHIDVRLATNERKYTKYVAKPNFVDRTWYKENLALVQMGKVRVILDKPVYVGMTILDHSKWWMYGFHYKMVDRYGVDKIRLAYMDTDSLIYNIRTADVYGDMLEHSDDFDTSNYPQDHLCYSPRNAKVLGKFKDESDGRAIEEFIGLMAKLYCIVYSNNNNEDGAACPAPIKRAKGVNRAVVAKHLSPEDYRRCLQRQVIKYTENDRFQSRHHNIYTVSVTKRSMAPYDDKRYIVLEDGGGGVHTLPWGHYAIPVPAPQQPPAAEGDYDDGDDELLRNLELLQHL